MSDFNLKPGAIDDPGAPGGPDLGQRTTPPGDTADDTGGPDQPHAAELDLPGPDDPVAWNYVEPGTEVVGPDGTHLGRVEAMLGTEVEGIFHGIAVKTDDHGTRVVAADAVSSLTPRQVTIAYGAGRLAAAEEYAPIER